jgi:hypothetical protein
LSGKKEKEAAVSMMDDGEQRSRTLNIISADGPTFSIEMALTVTALIRPCESDDPSVRSSQDDRLGIHDMPSRNSSTSRNDLLWHLVLLAPIVSSRGECESTPAVSFEPSYRE